MRSSRPLCKRSNFAGRSASRLRVLIVTFDFLPLPGGIAVFLHHLCAGLTERGNSVTVLAKSMPGDDESDAGLPYPVRRYGLPRRLASVATARQVLRQCLAHRPDVIFLGHIMSTLGLGAVLTKRLLGIPYVILSHGGDLGLGRMSSTDDRAMHVVLRDSSLVLANSRFTAQRLQETGCVKSAIEILNPGVDPGVFGPGVPTQEMMRIRKQYGLGNRRVVLTIGRLVPRKNHISVLRALPQVLEKIPEVCYLIVGDGEERPRLEQEVQHLGLEKVVIFAGQVPQTDLVACYAASDLFIMPSTMVGDNFEGFGIVFAEAGACGKPVISGRSGGVSDAVVDGVTGLLVDPLDVGEIADAIIRLLTDQAYARRLGKNGRKRAVQELDWNRVAERLEILLTETIANDELGHV